MAYTILADKTYQKDSRTWIKNGALGFEATTPLLITLGQSPSFDSSRQATVG